VGRNFSQDSWQRTYLSKQKEDIQNKDEIIQNAEIINEVKNHFASNAVAISDVVFFSGS
jgi:hypothetical protein